MIDYFPFLASKGKKRKERDEMVTIKAASGGNQKPLLYVHVHTSYMHRIVGKLDLITIHLICVAVMFRRNNK